MDIGVFGGTFDPVHFGHLTVAEEVRAKLGIDRLLFVPAGQPWLKADRPITPAEHRVEMLSLAVADNPRFTISTIEVDRPGPSYTVDTIADLRRYLLDEVKIYFLLGSDALAELPQWKEPSRLVQLCQLVAFNRPGAPPASLELLESAIPGISQQLSLIEVSSMDISATQIRIAVAQGASLGQFVPRDVERYILEQKLYRD
jgi:nicotinate-nucleotide adenylyltransferase